MGHQPADLATGGSDDQPHSSPLRWRRAFRMRLGSIGLIVATLLGVGVADAGQAADTLPREEVARRAAPGVVRITGYMNGNTEAAYVEASGFFVGEDNLLVSVSNVFTNHDSRELCDTFVVRLFDGRRAQADMVSVDGILNLITFKVRSSERDPVPGQDFMETVNPGTTVLALAGAPTAGTVQYEVGEVKAPDKTSLYGAGLADMFIHSRMQPQTHFFGGPLLTTDGAVIGINGSNVHQPAAEQADAQDMHTLPMRVVRGFLRISKLYPTSEENWLGIAFRPLNSKEKDDVYKVIGQPAGLIVDYVWDRGPAAKADIRTNDILFSLNEEAITSLHGLNKVLWKSPRDQNVNLALLRDGKGMVRSVKVEKRPAWAGEVVATAQKTPPGNPTTAASER